MSGSRSYTGETEFSRIDVGINDEGPEEWPTIEVTVASLFTDDDERTIVLSMDEARCLIAALAWVVR